MAQHFFILLKYFIEGFLIKYIMHSYWYLYLGLKKRCLFPITLPTLILCPYPNLFIAQYIIFLKKKSKTL